MRLFIAEKPTVAKDIANALGNAKRENGYFICGDDYVTWCVGHIIESADPSQYDPSYGGKWNKDVLPLKMFPIKYVPKENTKSIVSTVVKLIKEADSIVHAGDPDDEGQLLVDEILLYANNTKPVKRILLNDNTDAAVTKALNNLKDNNNKEFKGMFNKALARSAADAIFGMSMTRAYTIDAQKNGYKGVLSVGRVQTPVLGLICQRYLDNKNHNQTFYQTINAEFDSKCGVFLSNWKVSDNCPQDEKKRLNNEDYAKKLVAFFKNKNANILSAGVEEKQTTPPLPFNLSELQQILNKKNKLSAEAVLNITQSLREKYKCITYNRSDCSYLSDEQFNEAPEILESLHKIYNDFDIVNPNRKSKAFNSENVTAHTAIIPTSNVPDLDKLTSDEKIVYLAIADRYLIQFMPNKAYKEASAVLKIDTETFSSRAINVTDKGFTAFYNDVESDDAIDDKDTQSDSQFNTISKLRTGDTVVCTDANYKNNKTTPPPLFTEASLLNAMDNISNFVTNEEIKKLLKEKDQGKKKGQRGIGTQATRASFVPILIKRGFVEMDKQKIIPTKSGLDFFNLLPKEITQPDLTALWSEKQRDIESGDLSVSAFIDDTYRHINELLKATNTTDVKISNNASMDKNDLICPKCKGVVAPTPKAYTCKNRCGFVIWKEIAKKTLTDKQIETLISKGKTSTIKGFKKKSGETFDCCLSLDNDFKVKFS
ncbi:DNA topoisomerase 3 [Providencia alcalifaciens]|uniref:type IA DNA topoisomerase n=1 Tax=Providencia alcalifaciens TaxID=126385 RepID=UPI0032DB50EF